MTDTLTPSEASASVTKLHLLHCPLVRGALQEKVLHKNISERKSMTRIQHNWKKMRQMASKSTAGSVF